MKKTKIITIIGARPQFVKAAAVSRVLRAAPEFQEIFLHTGQHYDKQMSQIFFDELDLPVPEYNLNIGSGLHGKQTGEMLASIEEILLREKPDRVLIYGDTNSTLAGALAAVKLHIPIAHVEAGLRLRDLTSPEEVNRIVADQLADMLFTPTALASENLRLENIPESRIFEIGDVMYDVALHFGEKSEKYSKILETLEVDKKEYILATIHRPENTDTPARLKNIMDALNEIAETMQVIFPVHPRTSKMLRTYHLLENVSDNLRLVDPAGFLDMIMLEKNAAVIVSDSGGVQKEAFFHRVPCVVLAQDTVWKEIVEAGWNKIVPPEDASTIRDAVLSARNTLGSMIQPYGIGNSSELIVEKLRAFYQ